MVFSIMQVSLEYLPDILVIALVGRLDTASAPEFDAELASILAEPKSNILLDLAGVTYISSAGLRSILQLVKHTAANNGRVGICAAPPHIMEVVEMSGFPSLLDIYPDRAAALSQRG
jgi:stage II sporulation protein AA (anti-sigma F factor antagonist)